MKYCKLLLLAAVFGSLIACNKNQAESKNNSTDNTFAVAEQTYKKNCKACHAQGIQGAPILGNKLMWNPRVEKGKEQLVNNASNGFGLMPAKGGNTSLSKSEIAEVVDYMLYKLQ